MKLFNLNTIVKIQAFDKRENERYKWYPLRSSLFGYYKYKAGYYYAFSLGASDYAFSMDEARKRFIVEGERLYDKPYIKVKFANSECDLVEKFDTLEAAEARCKEIEDMAINSVWLKKDV